MREVLQLLSILTDDARFMKTIDGVKEGDEPKNMSEALDMIEKRGIEKGIEQGIEHGIEHGIEQGIEQGIAQGMKTINMLYARLLKDGRIKDLERSVSDSAYQEQLLAELFPGR